MKLFTTAITAAPAPHGCEVGRSKALTLALEIAGAPVR